MNKKLKYLASAGMAVFVFAVAPLGLAQENASDSASSSVPESLKQRIEQHKEKFKIKLEAAEEARLKGRCIAAQAKIKSYRENINANVPARIRAYQNLQTRLDNLVEKLKAANVDTATLEQQLTELDKKIEAFNTNLAAYRQQLGDLRDIDCANDPEGFKAALEAARETRQKLASEIAGIKTYVTETIKPTLQTIREQLAAQEQQE